jgi:hypothetical protein
MQGIGKFMSNKASINVKKNNMASRRARVAAARGKNQQKRKARKDRATKEATKRRLKLLQKIGPKKRPRKTSIMPGPKVGKPGTNKNCRRKFLNLFDNIRKNPQHVNWSMALQLGVLDVFQHTNDENAYLIAASLKHHNIPAHKVMNRRMWA